MHSTMKQTVATIVHSSHIYTCSLLDTEHFYPINIAYGTIQNMPLFGSRMTPGELLLGWKMVLVMRSLCSAYMPTRQSPLSLQFL